MIGIIFSLFSCTYGTIPPEEIEYDYRVVPADSFEEMVSYTVQKLHRAVGTENLEFFEIYFSKTGTSAIVLHPNKKNRLYEYALDRYFIKNERLHSELSNSDKEKLFSLKELPIENLTTLADKAHQLSGVKPGSFCGLKIEKSSIHDKKNELTLSFCFFGSIDTPSSEKKSGRFFTFTLADLKTP